MSDVSGQPSIAQRLARWLLLSCTALGIAALHTIGHGSGDPQPASRPPIVVLIAATVIAGPTTLVVQNGDGCGGCRHDVVAAPDADDALYWLDVCVAVLTALVLAALFPRRLQPSPRSLADGSSDPRLRRRPCHVGHRLAGLSVAATAVIRA